MNIRREELVMNGVRNSNCLALLSICLIIILSLPALAFCTMTQIVQIEVSGDTDEDMVGDLPGYATLPLAFFAHEEGTDFWRLMTGPGEMFEGGLAIAAQNQPGTTLAWINELGLHMQEDPEIQLGFSVTTGVYATAFSFSSTIVGFSPIVNPLANANGSITVGSANNDKLWGSYSSKVFRTLYNVDPEDGSGGSIFADIITAPPAQAPGAWEIVSPQTIYDTVSNIHIKSQFFLSGSSIASGTSTFEVVPEPGTMALFGLGIMMLCRRKKSNL